MVRVGNWRLRFFYGSSFLWWLGLECGYEGRNLVGLGVCIVGVEKWRLEIVRFKEWSLNMFILEWRERFWVIGYSWDSFRIFFLDRGFFYLYVFCCFCVLIFFFDYFIKSKICFKFNIIREG